MPSKISSLTKSARAANTWKTRRRVFVCSGGGRDFMRTFAEETWGIYKENVIGSAAHYAYHDDAQREFASVNGAEASLTKAEQLG